MPLPTPPLEPMLARLEDDIPVGEDWLYEPKWDGFRVVVFRDGAEVRLLSRKGQWLERYFPEILAPLTEALPKRAVLDGELIVAGDEGLDFDALLQRVHPAPSRIQRLSKETPASFVAFDLLGEASRDLRERPLAERRSALVKAVTTSDDVSVTPQTDNLAEAERWFREGERAGLDGIVAKRKDQPYLVGERGWVKVKHQRTVDCVVGGYRRGASGVASILLGLHDAKGVLHHVGHVSAFPAAERRELAKKLAPLEGGTSFGEGRTPGQPSRWSRGRDASWIPVRPKLVCEVSFDHLQGDRFRHAAQFVRWRPDKRAADCTWDQLAPAGRASLAEVFSGRKPTRSKRKTRP